MHACDEDACIHPLIMQAGTSLPAPPLTCLDSVSPTTGHGIQGNVSLAPTEHQAVVSLMLC